MSYIALLLFFVVNIIRPQDWYAPLLGLPVVSILFWLILFGILLFPAKHELNIKHICSTFLAGYIGTVFFSSLMNVSLIYALDVTFSVSKMALFFLFPIMIVSTEKKAEIILFFIFLLILLIGIEIITVGQGGEGLAGQTRLQGSYYEKEMRVPWVGIWDGPNVVAVLLLIGSSISLVSLFNSQRFAYKLLFGMSLVIFALSIYYTGSRGAILAVPAVVAVYLVLMKKTKLLIVSGLIVLIIGYYFYNPERELSTKESSAHERVLLWEKGLTDLRYSSPLYGIGYGQFVNNPMKLISHSNYVQTFSELGMIGFFFFVSIFYIVISRMYLISSRSNIYGSEITYISQAVLLSLVAISVSTIFVIMNYEIMFFLLGMGVACEKIAERKSPTGFEFTKLDLKIIIASMSLILLLYYVLSVRRIF